MQHVERVWNSCGKKFICHGRREFIKTAITGFSTHLLKPNNHANNPINSYPQYWFNDRVVCEWYCDDNMDPRRGTSFRDYGAVVGIAYQIPEIPNSDWCYWVRWDYLEASSMQVPFTSAVAEVEIKPVTEQLLRSLNSKGYL